ncbi:hypothetical protein ECZU06_19300 [Escherichia coli]|nr:hypothetical protein ECZU06_19300 [Escherichia coli]
MVDLAGNVGATGSQSAQIDTVNPAQVLTIASISTDTGSSATDFITSDTSLTLTGSLGRGLPAAKWRRLASTAARPDHAHHQRHAVDLH